MVVAKAPEERFGAFVPFCGSDLCVRARAAASQQAVAAVRKQLGSCQVQYHMM